MFEYIDKLALFYKEYVGENPKKVYLAIKPDVETKYKVAELTKTFVLNNLPYLNLLMALMWVARNYRYDIFLACIFYSQFAKCYNQEIFDDLINVLLYLMNKRNYVLSYTTDKSERFKPFKITCYVDSSFKELPYSCSFIYLNENLIDVQVFTDKLYKGRELNDTVTKTSATHSEIYGIFMTMKRISYVYNFLNEFAQVQTPINVATDCDPARFILENRVNNKRTMHLAIKFRFVTELVERKFIKLIRHRGKDMISDVGTKALPRMPFEEWCEIIFDTQTNELFMQYEEFDAIIIHH
jgi:hypothetical protein